MQTTHYPMFKQVTKVTISPTANPMLLWALNKFNINAKTVQKEWR